MINRQQLRVRDPFIVPFEGFYYMYGTREERTVFCYRSRDLEHWEVQGDVFTIPEDSWGARDVWASEVHAYRSRFYLFVSLLGKNGLRGTQVAVADRPDVPFVPLCNRPLTPARQSCIDGTLFVENGTPYIVYSHDWPDNYVKEKNAYVGEICGVQVSEDLREAIGEPFCLFASDEAPLSRNTPHRVSRDGQSFVRYGSDGPFVQRLKDGRLLLTWSPYLQDHYVVLYAISESGSIRGPWRHGERPLFDGDGGHAMFFCDLSGTPLMCLHAPEKPPMERARLFRVAECAEGLSILSEI